MTDFTPEEVEQASHTAFAMRKQALRASVRGDARKLEGDDASAAQHYELCDKLKDAADYWQEVAEMRDTQGEGQGDGSK